MSADLLTTEEIAARWGCTRRHVEDQCRAGYLRASKLAGHWRITADDLAEYEAAQANRAPARRRRRRAA